MQVSRLTNKILCKKWDNVLRKADSIPTLFKRSAMNHAMNSFCAYIYYPGGLESYDYLTKDNSVCTTVRKLGAVYGPVSKNAKASIKNSHIHSTSGRGWRTLHSKCNDLVACRRWFYRKITWFQKMRSYINLTKVF